jgi:hypothetical protein
MTADRTIKKKATGYILTWWFMMMNPDWTVVAVGPYDSKALCAVASQPSIQHHFGGEVGLRNWMKNFFQAGPIS